MPCGQSAQADEYFAITAPPLTLLGSRVTVPTPRPTAVFAAVWVATALAIELAGWDHGRHQLPPPPPPAAPTVVPPEPLDAGDMADPLEDEKP